MSGFVRLPPPPSSWPARFTAAVCPWSARRAAGPVAHVPGERNGGSCDHTEEPDANLARLAQQPVLTAQILLGQASTSCSSPATPHLRTRCRSARCTAPPCSHLYRASAATLVAPCTSVRSNTTPWARADYATVQWTLMPLTPLKPLPGCPCLPYRARMSVLRAIVLEVQPLHVEMFLEHCLGCDGR